MNRPIRIAFTDFWHSNRPAVVAEMNPIHQLLAPHFDLQLSRRPDFLVYSCFGTRFLNYDCTRIFYTGENLRPNFAECDYAFSFDYPVDERNYRLPLYRLFGYYERLLQARSFAPEAAERPFCSFVYSNARARERVAFLEALSGYREVASGGRLLNNTGGPIANKMTFLPQFKFNICFENASHPGYTTEKILDALVCGTVPIYWGNPLVHLDFNPDCFINCHDFDSFEAVVRHVAAVDQDPQRYLAYLAAPPFAGNLPNEFVREDNIIARFERIFRGPTRSGVARPGDRLRYLASPRTFKWVARRVKNWAQGRTYRRPRF